MSTDDKSPASAYGAQVADIIASAPRESSYQPAQPVELFVRERRLVSSVDALEPTERAQLEKMFAGDDLARAIREGIEDMPIDLEVAKVVDEGGQLRYRLYGWNFGVIYLMSAEGLDCLAFAAQHDLEHWHVDQRDLFWAMDRAMRRNDHGFGQPMKSCWWDDKCWADIANAAPGTLQSEPYIRRQFGGDN